jgi:hypothetical protein
MKKVRLVLDDLQVESFAVNPEIEGTGTVAGLAEAVGSNVHSQCYTHCLSDCEGSCTCQTNAPSHCPGDSCGCTENEYECWSWYFGCETIATA